MNPSPTTLPSPQCAISADTICDHLDLHALNFALSQVHTLMRLKPRLCFVYSLHLQSIDSISVAPLRGNTPIHPSLILIMNVFSEYICIISLQFQIFASSYAGTIQKPEDKAFPRIFSHPCMDSISERYKFMVI